MSLLSFLKMFRPFRRTSRPPAAHEPDAKPPEPVAPPTPEEVLTREGHRLLFKIGEGGYGRVWMAEMPGGYLFHALKIVQTKDGDTGALDRESRAVELVRALPQKSEYLISVEDVEVHGEHGFLSYSMPLADDATGSPVLREKTYVPRTLDTELKRSGRLPVAECVEIGKRVLGALKVLHGVGLIHRDIKPGNVVYLKGKPVLADFGLVTHACGDVSQVCSPSNRPEEGVGAPPGDLYALAVLLYRLATGEAAADFPSVRNPGDDPAFPRLNRVITMAGDKDPNRRYVNARAMELALDWVLEDPTQKAKEEPQGQGTSWLGRLVGRATAKRPEPPPGVAAFMERIGNTIELTKTDILLADPERDFVTCQELGQIADEATREFERRVGHEPRLVRSACFMAQASLAPDKKKRDELLKQALAAGGGATGIGMVITGVGFALGWGQGVIQAVIAWFYGVSLLGPVALAVGGVTLAVVSVWFATRKPDPKLQSDRAVNALIEGLKGATEALWDEYGDQLSVV